MKQQLWTAYAKIYGHDSLEIIIVMANDYPEASSIVYDVLLDDWDVLPEDVVYCDIYLGVQVNTKDSWFSMQQVDPDDLTWEMGERNRYGDGTRTVGAECEVDDDEE